MYRSVCRECNLPVNAADNECKACGAPTNNQFNQAMSKEEAPAESILPIFGSASSLRQEATALKHEAAAMPRSEFDPPAGGQEFTTQKAVIRLPALPGRRKFSAPVPVFSRIIAAPTSPLPRLRVRVLYGWLTSYSQAARRQMPPAPGPRVIRQKPPQPLIVFPGPLFGPSLRLSISDQQLEVSEFDFRQQPSPLTKRSSLPRMSPWLYAALIVGTLLGAGFSSMFSMGARPGSRPNLLQTTAHAEAQAEQVETTPAAPPVYATSSLSRAIEVSGFRVTGDAAGKFQMQYVMVNHSGARLSGVTVFVTLREANAQVGQAPLAQFSFVAPELDAQEAKQMVSPVEGVRKQLLLPDWNDLRAEVQVSQ